MPPEFILNIEQLSCVRQDSCFNACFIAVIKHDRLVKQHSGAGGGDAFDQVMRGEYCPDNAVDNLRSILIILPQFPLAGCAVHISDERQSHGGDGDGYAAAVTSGKDSPVAAFEHCHCALNWSRLPVAVDIREEIV